MSNSRIRTCLHCGKEYEFCLNCGDYFQNNFSYRVAYCSPECYQEVEKQAMGIGNEQAYFVKDEVIEKITEEVVDTIKRK